MDGHLFDGKQDFLAHLEEQRSRRSRGASSSAAFISFHLVFLSLLGGPQEEFYGRELIVADRELVEQQAHQILEDARGTDVAFLVVGDPFG